MVLNRLRNNSLVNNNKAIFNYDKSNINTLVSTTKLTFLERGQIYKEFMIKYNFNSKDVAAIFEKSESIISQDINSYESFMLSGIDLNKFKDVNESTVKKALQQNFVSSEDYLKVYQQFRDYMDFGTFHTIISGKVDTDKLVLRLQIVHDKKIKGINKLIEYLTENKLK